MRRGHAPGKEIARQRRAEHVFERAGEQYHQTLDDDDHVARDVRHVEGDFRAALMVRNDEGLTKTYNRFHDPDETHPDILQLRDLHADMDRAVKTIAGSDRSMGIIVEGV